MSLTIHPEVQELLRQREMLREALATLVEEWHALHHIEKPNLLALYQQKLGAWELKRLEKQVKALRLKRHIELVQAALNRGGTPAWHDIERQIIEELALWQQKVGEAAKALQDAEQRLKSLLSPEDSAQLKRTYHTLVKRLHPDLNPTQPAEHAALWEQVQAAYERCDIATLQSLELLTESARPADTAAVSALDTLRAENEVMRARIEPLRVKIALARKEPPFTLEPLLSDAARVDARRTEIEQEMTALDSQIETLQTHLQTLLPPPLNPDGLIFGSN